MKSFFFGPVTRIVGYDHSSRIAQMSDGPQTFSYDGLDRLKTWGGPTARTYTYDASGNVTNDGSRTFA